jgi:hypothetical protein
MRDADEAAGQALRQDLGGALLMCWVGGGMQEGDGHRLDRRGRDAVRDFMQRGFIERQFHLPAPIQPFQHLKAPAAGH